MFLTCALALLATAKPEVRLPAAEVGTTRYQRTQLVAALYVFSANMVLAPGAKPTEPARPIVLVWEDGRVLWSENALEGGPPYRSGTVEPARVTAIVEKFKKREPLNKESLGPDATYATLVLRLPEGKYAQLKSWHPRDPNAKFIATSTGLVARDGRDPAAVLAKDTAEYQAFRKLWQELEDELISVAHVATGAKPVTAKLEWD
jgi:hypothetical protein